MSSAPLPPGRVLRRPAAANAAGQTRTQLSLPGPMPPGMSAAVQAILFNSCSPWGITFSQAHTFSWN